MSLQQAIIVKGLKQHVCLIIARVISSLLTVFIAKEQTHGKIII
jgi:hypothetical protein